MQRETTPAHLYDAPTEVTEPTTDRPSARLFIKDLGSDLTGVAITANHFTTSSVLDSLDTDVLRDAPRRKPAAAFVETADDEMVAVDEEFEEIIAYNYPKTAEQAIATRPAKTEAKERRSPRFQRVRQLLGRTATALTSKTITTSPSSSKKSPGVPPVAPAMNAASTAYYNMVVTAVSKIPTTKSKQEMLDANRLQKERYADKASDSFLTRRMNALRRNKYEMLSWAPVAAMGVVALEMYAMRSSGYLNMLQDPWVDAAPSTVSMPWHSETASMAMPEAHQAAVVSHAQVNTVPLEKPLPTAAVNNHATPHQPVAPNQAAAPAHTKTPTSHNTWKPQAPAKHGTWHPDTPWQTSTNGNEVVTFATGGAFDDTSGLFTHRLIETGNVDLTKTKIVPTISPKDMAPFAGGPLSTDKSVAITAKVLEDNVRAELARNPNIQIRFQNFSEGNMAGNLVANKLQAEGYNVQSVNYGDPESAIGMQNKSSAANPFVKSIMDNLGIKYIPDPKNAIIVNDNMDMWGTSAGDGALSTADKGVHIPINHRVVDMQHEKPTQVFKIGSQLYLNYGGPDGSPGRPVAVPPNATDLSGVPGLDFHKFRPDAVVNNINGTGANIDQNNLTPVDPSVAPQPAPADAVPAPGRNAQPPVAPASERSSTPSFFGEQACVAKDGSPYYTPGNAPC